MVSAVNFFCTSAVLVLCPQSSLSVAQEAAGLLVQEPGGSLFAGKTAFDEAVTPEVSAVPQAAASQSAFGAANDAGTGPDFGASSSQVRCSNHLLLADMLQAATAAWYPGFAGCDALVCLVALPKNAWGDDSRRGLFLLASLLSSSEAVCGTSSKAAG